MHRVSVIAGEQPPAQAHARKEHKTCRTLRPACLVLLLLARRRWWTSAKLPKPRSSFATLDASSTASGRVNLSSDHAVQREQKMKQSVETVLTTTWRDENGSSKSVRIPIRFERLDGPYVAQLCNREWWSRMRLGREDER